MLFLAGILGLPLLSDLLNRDLWSVFSFFILPDAKGKSNNPVVKLLSREPRKKERPELGRNVSAYSPSQRANKKETKTKHQKRKKKMNAETVKKPHYILEKIYSCSQDPMKCEHRLPIFRGCYFPFVVSTAVAPDQILSFSLIWKQKKSQVSAQSVKILVSFFNWHVLCFGHLYVRT